MNVLPEVTITSNDRRHLVALATAALPTPRDGVAASMLLSEIARAHVVRPESLPPDVVALDREIEVRDNVKGTTERLRIVLPGEEGDDRHAISILTSVGATLFGLSEGASVDWCTAAKDRKSLTVLRVRPRKRIHYSGREREKPHSMLAAIVSARNRIPREDV